MNDHQPTSEPTHETQQGPPALRPRVWVGSLADYNDGHLHGDWMDAAVPAEQLQVAVQQMLARSTQPGAEEWGIFDYDEFGSYRVGEYADLNTVTAVARGIAEHGPAFAAWATLHEGDPEDLSSTFTEAFIGHYESAEAWAGDILGLNGVFDVFAEHLPNWLVGHVRIDLQGVVRDLSHGVHIEPSPNGGVYLFDART